VMIVMMMAGVKIESMMRVKVSHASGKHGGRGTMDGSITKKTEQNKDRNQIYTWPYDFRMGGHELHTRARAGKKINNKQKVTGQGGGPIQRDGHEAEENREDTRCAF